MRAAALLAGLALACPPPAGAALCQTVHVTGLGLQPLVQCVPYPPGEEFCNTRKEKVSGDVGAEVTVCQPAAG